MVYIIFGLILLAIIFLPGIWVQRVLSRYSEPDDRYSGTGADLARHLLDKYGMKSVSVEETKDGDHYDPTAKAVRLTPDKFNGRSLTAITVAAHEVGHAMQDHKGYKPLRYRSRLVKVTQKFEKLGAGVLMVSPFIGAITRVPGLGILMFLGGMMTLGTSTLVHLVTLPTEFDASFNRALPMLDESNILMKSDQRHARKLLKAAAFTYVSASLMSLLKVSLLYFPGTAENNGRPPGQRQELAFSQTTQSSR
jgi:Zn-dependent membrane protease YugP